jgi:hypothetical protein
MMHGFLAIVSAALAGTAVDAPPLTSGLTMIAQPTAVAPDGGAMPITGYRSARFLMTMKQVRAAAAADFGTAVATALHPVSVEPGFTALSTVAANMVGGRPAEIRYVFRDGVLVAVNLFVRTGAAPNDVERAALVDLARARAADLLGHRWRLFSTVRGRPESANAVLVAAVTDDRGNGANIELSGIAYTARFDDGSERTSPPPKGPAALRIVYARDIENRFALAPGAFLSAAAPYRIDGFRSVRFGMTENEVLPLAARDLNVLPVAIERLEYSKEGTTVLVGGTMRLDPGPTPARVSYVFGATSRKLVQIVVQWSYPADATELQRQSIVDAGLHLAAHLSAIDKAAVRSDSGGAIGSDLILHRAWDRAGASLALSMSGVPFDRMVDGKPAPVMPSGPPTLRLVYARDAEHPDILSR